MRARKMLNLLVLLTMALGLFLAPTGSVSADPSGPLVADSPKDVEVIPANAKAGAHIVVMFQTTTPIPLTGEVFVQFPTGYYTGTTQIDDLAGHPEWTQVTWLIPPANPSDACYDASTIFSPTAESDYFPIPDPAVNPLNPEDKVVNWDTCTGWTGMPDAVNTRMTPGLGWIPEGQVRLSMNPNTNGKTTDNVPAGSYIRVDFWGPSSENPGEENAGITNPDPGDYCFCMATDEEDELDPYPECSVPEDCEDHNLGTVKAWKCSSQAIDPPFAVRLYRKYQIPLYSCGYKELQYIGGFTEIQPALDAANAIWLNAGDYTHEEMWNLYDACPNVDELLDAGGDPLDNTGGEEGFLNAVDEGVPVGAVIVVDADSDGDGVADVYSETLVMDTPGVILGSMPNEATGVDRAVINAGGEAPESNWDDKFDGPYLDAGVAIEAGGITFGESNIQLMVGDPLGDENGVFSLNGFVLQNAGGNGDESQGVSVFPWGDKCYNSEGVAHLAGPTEVYGSEIQEYAVLSYTVNYTFTGNTLVFTNTAAGAEPWALDTTKLVQDAKLVNLTTGWNGHISTTLCSKLGLAYVEPGNVCLEILAGKPNGNTIEINAERFKEGDAIGVFNPSQMYECQEARVDIRGNDILSTTHHGELEYGNGIHVYSAAVWVDANHVYDNDGDGFYGENLYCEGAVVVCDGMDRSPLLLELSNNLFELNGMTTREMWTGADDWGGECFLPEVAEDDTYGFLGYDDAGVKIVSTAYFNTVTAGPLDQMVDTPLFIHDNDILDNMATGLWLGPDAAVCGVRVLRNDIETNEVFGVSSWADSAGKDCDEPEDCDYYQPTSFDEVDVIFKYNDVIGNGLWGVKNWAYDYDDWGDLNRGDLGMGGPLFNAKENYWNYCDPDPDPGSPLQVSCPPGGPSAGPVACAHDFDQQSGALGYGDAVNKGTFYNPWLAVNWEALLDVETQGMRAYGSDSLQLQAGWNTLAVPIDLDDNFDTAAEILALGTFLDADVDGDGEEEELVERIYEFDNTQGWAQGPEIEAVHGYYIKINPDLLAEMEKTYTRFPVIYNVERGSGLPSYDLLNNEVTGGWNLVGAPFGIDKTDADTDGDMVIAYIGGSAGDGGCPSCDTVRVNELDDYDQGRYAVASPDPEHYELFDPLPQDAGFDYEAIKWAGTVLESVVWGDNFSNGASLVINPGVPGQIEPFWARTVQDIYNTPGALGDGEAASMYTGEAYWVFMREDATLAGFEMTPLYLNYGPFPIPLW